MVADETPEEPQSFSAFKVVEVVDVIVPLPLVHAEVHLSESEPPYRSLEFPIGLAEGAALVHARERSRGQRPSTHELLAELLVRSGVEVIALRITAREGGILLAEIDTMGPRGREVVACRPSDGLVVCLRQMVQAPILVAEELFEVDE